MARTTPSTPPITKPPAGLRRRDSRRRRARRVRRCQPHGSDLDRRRGGRAVVRGILPRRDAGPLERLDRRRSRPDAHGSETQPSTEDYEAALEEILPAGAAVRAGAGVPEAGKGYEGEVYIDISTSDVYLFKDGEWVQVGNIRASAAANLTGETGAAGEAGAAGETGATGETGAPGAPGTQLSLGLGAPERRALPGGRRRLQSTPRSSRSTSAPAERGRWLRCRKRPGRPRAPTAGSDG